MTYFDSFKKKQQDQGGKNLCCTEYFVSLTISNLRTTAFCFENKFRVTIYLLWLGFTPCKAEQLLRGMELKGKITKKRLYTGYRKSV